MSKWRLLVVAMLLIGGCESTGIVPDIRGKSAAIEPGAKKTDVLAIMGPPGNRTFSGNREALQYCETGFFSDDYVTVWLEDGLVHGLTTYQGSYAAGSCAQFFAAIDWGQFPYSSKIKIDHDIKIQGN